MVKKTKNKRTVFCFIRNPDDVALGYAKDKLQSLFGSAFKGLFPYNDDVELGSHLVGIEPTHCDLIIAITDNKEDLEALSGFCQLYDNPPDLLHIPSKKLPDLLRIVIEHRLSRKTNTKQERKWLVDSIDFYEALNNPEIFENKDEFVIKKPFKVPLGIVGVLAGAGEVGKTTLACLLGLMANAYGNSALFVSLEEDKRLVLRRINYLYQRLPLETMARINENSLENKVSFEVAYAELGQLIHPRTFDLTEIGQSFIDFINAKVENGVKLIFIDHYTRLGIDDLKHEAIARMYSIFSQIAFKGATIILLHHFNKASFEETKKITVRDLKNQSYFVRTFIRGSTAIVDNARFVLQMFRTSVLNTKGGTAFMREKFKELANDKGFVTVLTAKDNTSEVRNPIVHLSLFDRRKRKIACIYDEDVESYILARNGWKGEEYGPLVI